jgi:hypothetical protein
LISPFRYFLFHHFTISLFFLDELEKLEKLDKLYKLSAFFTTLFLIFAIFLNIYIARIINIIKNITKGRIAITAVIIPLNTSVKPSNPFLKLWLIS